MTQTFEPLTPSTLQPLKKGWRWVRLGEVCDLLPSKSLATNGDTPVQAITTACLAETGFQPSGIKSAYMWRSDAIQCVVSSGEILVARSNTPDLVGRVALFTGEPKGAVASDLTIRVWPRNDIECLYLTFFLSFLFVNRYWKDHASGTSGSMKKITRSQIKSVEIPLPPFSEQCHIAAKIQELMQGIERARTASKKQLEAAKALPAAYLREAFENEEAKKWEKKMLGEVILFIKNGIVAEQNFEEKGFQVTRIETISDGVIDSGKIGWVNLSLENFIDFKLYKGDILFSHINSVEKLGNCAIYEGIPENLYHGMNLLRIKANEDILEPYFFLYWLRSDVCQNYYNTNARRAIGQASLNQKDIKQMPIHLPPRHIQHRIATELKEKMVQVENLQSVIINQQSTLGVLPQAILRKAFRG